MSACRTLLQLVPTATQAPAPHQPRGVAAGDVVEKVSPRGLRAKLEVPWAKDDIVDQPVLDNIR